MVSAGRFAAMPTSSASISPRVAVCMLSMSTRPRATGSTRSTRSRSFAPRVSRVPENTLKFGVGVMLSAFGVFWTGEGLGVEWPGQDLVLFGLGALFLLTGLATASLLRHPSVEALR